MSSSDSIAIAAIFISIVSLGVSIVLSLRDSKIRREQNTIETYNDLQRNVFPIFHEFTTEDIRKIAIDKNDGDYKKLSQKLALINQFCIGVNNNIYDINILYKLSHEYFDDGTLRRRLEPLVNAKCHPPKKEYYSNISEVWKQMEKISKKKKKGFNIFGKHIELSITDNIYASKCVTADKTVM